MNEALKASLLCVALSLTSGLFGHAADDKIRKAIDQGLVTGEFLKTLTYERRSRGLEGTKEVRTE